MIEPVVLLSNFRAALYSAMPQGSAKFPFHWVQGTELRMELVAKAEERDRWIQKQKKRNGSRQNGFSSAEIAHVACPDAFGALNVPGESDDRAGLYFLVEMDRSTMDHKRMLEKYRAYWVLWREGVIRNRFRVEHAVVLTVCKSRQRRDNLAALARNVDDRKTGSRLTRLYAPQEPHG